MAKAEEPSDITTQPIDPLSEHFHKARKSLAFWSGILFAWEIVGIDISKLSGDVGSLAKAIKSPQTIPWVLVVLVFYFGFRTWLEWLQCATPRRALLVSRIDLGSSTMIALAALALYGWQNLFGERLVVVLEHSLFSKISPTVTVITMAAAIAGGAISLLTRQLQGIFRLSQAERKHNLFRAITPTLLTFVLLLGLLFFVLDESSAADTFYIIAIAAVTSYFGVPVLRGVSRRIEREHSDLLEQISLQVAWSRAILALEPTATASEQEEAIAELNTMILKFPLNCKAAVVLGRLYKVREDYQNAINVLERFIKHKVAAGEGQDRYTAMAYYNQACYHSLAFSKSGDTYARDAAFEKLRKSVMLDPELRGDAIVDRDFESVRQDDEFQRIVSDG